MRRRTMLAGLGSTALLPSSVKAQQQPVPVVGYLAIGNRESRPHYVASFQRGLAEAGLVVGRDFTIEYRWAGARYDDLLTLAQELVRRNVDVIMAGSNFAATAARRATSTIPIVFAIGSDPIAEGLVSSYNRPGGNATGVAFMASELGPKRLELLHEMVPGVPISVLVNARRPNAVALANDLVTAGAVIGLGLSVVELDPLGDPDRPLVEARSKGTRALLVRNDPAFNTMHEKLAALALRHRLPAMFFSREFVEAGGLASYSANIAALYHQAGMYVARVLAGDKPANLPVVQPTRFELVINLKTAKALGIEVPPMLLARADEVIE